MGSISIAPREPYEARASNDLPKTHFALKSYMDFKVLKSIGRV